MKPFTLESPNGSYSFDVHANPGEVPNCGGIYLYLRQMTNGDWRILYVGQANCLTRSLRCDHNSNDGHARAFDLGATHVATFSGDFDELDRRLIEKELISLFHPPANDNENSVEKLIQLLTASK